MSRKARKRANKREKLTRDEAKRQRAGPLPERKAMSLIDPGSKVISSPGAQLYDPFVPRIYGTPDPPTEET